MQVPMDWLDWIVRGAGAVFGLLTLLFGFSRISSFTERDISVLWWLGFAVVGAVWAIAQITDWIVPISTTIYLANGGKEALPARIGGDQFCIPEKSYDGFTWRFGAPNTVTVGGEASQPERRYTIDRGTWFINLSSTVVTADMYESSGTIDFDALFSDQQGAIHVSSKLGRPFRLFSQTPLDRMYSPDGDVMRDSTEGPCPATAASATTLEARKP
jgi:hypothetical protein